MAFAIYSAAAFLSASGDAFVAPLASVELRKESDNTLATLYSDVNGASPLANPFLADSEGQFSCYLSASPRGFKITVTSGSNVRVLRNQAIGTAAEYDASDVLGPLLNTATAAAFLTALGGATQAYVDAVAAGLDGKGSCILATTADDTLSGLAARDGVTPLAGERVLVKSQAAPAANGIYVAASGAWARALDMDTWLEVPGSMVFVEQGTVNADTAWLCTSDKGGTLGVTSITWTQFVGPTLFQLRDATLTALAALTIAADSLTIGTGADAFSQVTFAANKFPAKSSAGGLVAKDITDFALTFLDDANAAAVLATIGAQTLDATLTALAALTIAADSLSIGTGADAFSQVTFAANKFPAKSSAGGLVAKDITDLALAFVALSTTLAQRAAIIVGNIDQNSKSAAYTTVLGDNGLHLLHPAADNNPRTFTIDSNANVAYPIGATITFVNEINVLTIAITTDTLTLAGTGSTGSRILAANGMATAMKITATKWMINGTGLT